MGKSVLEALVSSSVCAGDLNDQSFLGRDEGSGVNLLGLQCCSFLKMKRLVDSALVYLHKLLLI